jgi:hypothetical protein
VYTAGSFRQRQIARLIPCLAGRPQKLSTSGSSCTRTQRYHGTESASIGHIHVRGAARRATGDPPRLWAVPSILSEQCVSTGLENPAETFGDSPVFQGWLPGAQRPASSAWAKESGPAQVLSSLAGLIWPFAQVSPPPLRRLAGQSPRWYPQSGKTPPFRPQAGLNLSPFLCGKEAVVASQ